MSFPYESQHEELGESYTGIISIWNNLLDERLHVHILFALEGTICKLEKTSIIRSFTSLSMSPPPPLILASFPTLNCLIPQPLQAGPPSPMPHTASGPPPPPHNPPPRPAGPPPCGGGGRLAKPSILRFGRLTSHLPLQRLKPLDIADTLRPSHSCCSQPQ